MTLLMCLNECSYQQTGATVVEIGAALEQLVTVLRAVRERRTDTAVVAEATFGRLMIGDGVAFARWQADNRNREVARFLKLQLTRSPFSSVLADHVATATEYTHKGVRATGLGVAHLVDGLAVSLALTSGWDSAYIELQCQALTEDDDGDVDLLATTEQVRHASDATHVVEHRAWIAEAGTEDLHTGRALWEVRGAIFPHLRFLPRVEDDLTRLQPVWLRSVRKTLAAFETAAAAWTPSLGVIAPIWPTKVTPEHDQRKAKCYFDDPEAGGMVLFDTHARFTPWSGRMHFRWDAATRKVVIAYIGEKVR